MAACWNFRDRRGAGAWRTALVLTALLAGGCAQTLTIAQRKHMAAAERAVQDKQYHGADKELTAFLEDAPADSTERGRALYLRALTRAQLGERSLAYSDARAGLDAPSTSDVRWRTAALLGTLAFEDGRWEEAADSLVLAVQHMPKRPPRDTALFRLALSQERSGRWEAARETFGRLAQEFPGTPMAESAQRRVELNADGFAIKCGAFAEARNADLQRSTLAKKGLSAYVRRDQHKDRALNIVLVGRYSTYEQALAHLMMVRKVVPDAVIWP